MSESIYAAWASPEGNIPVDENVSRALSCELGRSVCEHVGSAAETIGEEQDAVEVYNVRMMHVQLSERMYLVQQHYEIAQFP